MGTRLSLRCPSACHYYDIIPKEFIQIELELPLESESENRVFTGEDFHSPTWQGYTTTCYKIIPALDNIIAILSLFKEKITEYCRILETTPSETKFHHLMTLVNQFNFDKLRDFVAKQTRM